MPRRRVEELPAPSPRLDRPQRFIGHARIVEYFRRVGASGLAHAYLFHGPRGVGKTTFARTLALTLHCERPTSFPTGYCGECGPCLRGMHGSSGDTIYVNDDFIAALDTKSERKVQGVNIDVAHEIRRQMQMRSYEGGRLICIVPNFDAITFDFVYNTFLKELEEPDPGKLFLLTAERADRILPTVRSRAVLVRFDPLQEREVADALVARYGEEPARAAVLARRAQGSLGEALEQREEGASEARDAARRWVLACLARPAALPPMPALDPDDPRQALDLVLRHARTAVRDLMAYALAGDGAVLDLESVAEYRKTRDALGPAAATRAMQALALFDEADRMAATNVAPATILGWLQVRLRSLADS